MFSMAAAPVDLEAILKSARVVRGVQAVSATAVPSGWAAFDAVLPDRGLPRGVTELVAPELAGGATTVALAAMRAAHERDPRAWCAWLEVAGEASLYAPAVERAGVDRARLMVTRAPSARDLPRLASKIAGSGAFDVVAVRGASSFDVRAVRRLALATEEHGGVVLLVTDAYVTHEVWPTALRLELTRTPAAISVRVARDRRGRTSAARSVGLPTSGPTVGALAVA